MANAKLTINDLPNELTSLADDDLLAVWDTSGISTAKITSANVTASLVAPAVTVEATNRINADAGLQAQIDLKAPLADPDLTGVPTAPTAAPGTNDSTIANTAFVTAAVNSASGAVVSVNGEVGAVVLDATDVGLGGFAGYTPATLPLSTADVGALATKEPNIAVGTVAQYWRGDKTFQPSIDLPLSTATQAALDLKANLAAPTFQKTTGAGTTAGGRIVFDLPITGSTLSGPPRIDIAGNYTRFFEGGGTARGAFLDLSRADPGVGSEVAFRSDVSAALVNTPLTGLPTAPTQVDGASSGLIANKERVVREIWRYKADVRFYGALLDGSTDDSSAINACVAANGVAFIPWTATGFVAKDIALGIGQHIIGDSTPPRYILAAAATKGFYVSAYHVGTGPNLVGNYTTISNILFDAAACPTSTTAIRAKTSGVQPVFGVRVINCSFVNCGEAIGDETSASNYVVDFVIDGCYFAFLRGRQIYFSRSAGFITVENTKIDQSLDIAATATYEYCRFENAAGLILREFDVVGTPFDTTSRAGSIGIVVSSAISLWCSRVLVDSVNGYGVYFQNVQNFVGNALETNLTMLDGITFNTVTRSRMVNTSVWGAKARTGAPANVAGIRYITCSTFTDADTAIYDCTGIGKPMTDTTHITSTASLVTGCLAQGVYMDGTSDKVAHYGLHSYGNTGNSLVQAGADSVTRDLYPQGGGGALVQSTVGVATVA